jgi:hypothetical protein
MSYSIEEAYTKKSFAVYCTTKDHADQFKEIAPDCTWRNNMKGKTGWLLKTDYLSEITKLVEKLNKAGANISSANSEESKIEISALKANVKTRKGQNRYRRAGSDDEKPAPTPVAPKRKGRPPTKRDVFDDTDDDSNKESDKQEEREEGKKSDGRNVKKDLKTITSPEKPVAEKPKRKLDKPITQAASSETKAKNPDKKRVVSEDSDASQSEDENIKNKPRDESDHEDKGDDTHDEDEEDGGYNRSDVYGSDKEDISDASEEDENEDENEDSDDLSDDSPPKKVSDRFSRKQIPTPVKPDPRPETKPNVKPDPKLSQRPAARPVQLPSRPVGKKPSKYTDSEEESEDSDRHSSHKKYKSKKSFERRKYSSKPAHTEKYSKYKELARRKPVVLSEESTDETQSEDDFPSPSPIRKDKYMDIVNRMKTLEKMLKKK